MIKMQVNPDNQQNRAVPHADVILRLSKIGIGAILSGGEFEFAIYKDNQEIARASNDTQGLITFPMVSVYDAGQYDYTVKEISAPPGWQTDSMVYPIQFLVYQGGPTGLIANVSYPNGVPGFANKHVSETCGLVEFANLTFNAPGTYEYSIMELTTSGGGWQTDDTEGYVTVHVIDDGYGNLIATVEYPDGFPLFINRYETKPTTVTISACKIAVGAPLPEGRFEFGLFDEDGSLVATTTNGPAKESV